MWFKGPAGLGKSVMKGKGNLVSFRARNASSIPCVKVSMFRFFHKSGFTAVASHINLSYSVLRHDNVSFTESFVFFTNTCTFILYQFPHLKHFAFILVSHCLNVIRFTTFRRPCTLLLFFPTLSVCLKAIGISPNTKLHLRDLYDMFLEFSLTGILYCLLKVLLCYKLKVCNSVLLWTNKNSICLSLDTKIPEQLTNNQGVLHVIDISRYCPSVYLNVPIGAFTLVCWECYL